MIPLHKQLRLFSKSPVENLISRSYQQFCNYSAYVCVITFEKRVLFCEHKWPKKPKTAKQIPIFPDKQTLFFESTGFVSFIRVSNDNFPFVKRYLIDKECI